MVDIATTEIEPLTHESPAPRRKSKFRFLGWVIGIVVIGGMVIATLLPSLCKAREPANRAKCASNLHQIGLAITLYAQENGGQFPPSLAVVMKEEQLTSAVMVCPSSNDESSSAADPIAIAAEVLAAETNEPAHKHCLSYIYAGSKLTTQTANSTAIVAYEPLSNHQDQGTDVLFGDGHSEWIGKSAWQKMATDAGVAVVRSPATRP